MGIDQGSAQQLIIILDIFLMLRFGYSIYLFFPLLLYFFIFDTG